MERVRASTSYPIVLPPTGSGRPGAVRRGHRTGRRHHVAAREADGLRSFFVVCTRPRGFRAGRSRNRFYDVFFWRHPAHAGGA